MIHKIVNFIVSIKKPFSHKKIYKSFAKSLNYIAPRAAKCSRRPLIWAGQSEFSQYQATSPSGLNKLELQAGHFEGGFTGLFFLFRSLKTTPTILGITSPPFSIITLSPILMSLRFISSKL